VVKLKSSLQKFYGRHHNLVNRYETSVFGPFLIDDFSVLIGFVTKVTQWVALME